jgi:hypothetical protein
LSLLRVRGRTQSTNADDNHHDNRSENQAASFHQNSPHLFHDRLLWKFSDCDGLLPVPMLISLRRTSADKIAGMIIAIAMAGAK